MNSNLLSIIIVNYNAPDMLARCLASIDSFLKNLEKEVIVVDNNSRTEFLDHHQQQYPYLKVIRLRENLGFGQANNIGAESASGRVLLLLNSDTELIDSSLCDAIDRFEAAPAGNLWGLKLLWPDGRFQNSYSREIRFSDFLVSYTPLAAVFRNSSRVKAHKYDGLPFSEVSDVDVVYGTAMLLKRDDFLALKGFSSDYFMYFEDIEFCDRFRKELRGRISVYPYTSVIHHVQGSSGERIVNWSYQKHKYLYGLRKFGAWKMSLIALVDIPLLPLQYLYTRLAATVR